MITKIGSIAIIFVGQIAFADSMKLSTLRGDSVQVSQTEDAMPNYSCDAYEDVSAMNDQGASATDFHFIYKVRAEEAIAAVRRADSFLKADNGVKKSASISRMIKNNWYDIECRHFRN
jgi:hypothetical protein